MKHHMSVEQFKHAYMANAKGGNRVRRVSLVPRFRAGALGDSLSYTKGGRSSRASIGSYDKNLSIGRGRGTSPSKNSTARRGSGLSNYGA